MQFYFAVLKMLVLKGSGSNSQGNDQNFRKIPRVKTCLFQDGTNKTTYMDSLKLYKFKIYLHTRQKQNNHFTSNVY